MATYEQNFWINNKTKLNAANLNNIEDGINEALAAAADAKLTAGTNITIDENNVISAIDTTYTAGTNISIFGTTISLDSNIPNRIGFLGEGLTTEKSAREAKDTELANAISDEIDIRTETDLNLANAISTETGLRANKDTELATAISNEVKARADKDTELANAINTEITERVNSDSGLAKAINAEITERVNSDSGLASAINAEITERVNSDSGLASAINAEITERANTDAAIAGALDKEVSARAEKDTELATAISNEVKARADKDSELANAISNEASTRETADSSLSTRIDNLSARGRFLSTWDAENGKPSDYPPIPEGAESPYIYKYKAGDYYIISNVAAAGSMNYKPNGPYIEAKKTGETWTWNIGTIEDTSELGSNDYYTCSTASESGSTWVLIQNTQKTVTFSAIQGEPKSNTNLAAALDSKVDKPTEPVTGQGVNVPYYFDIKYEADKATVTDYTIDLLDNLKGPKTFSIDIAAATTETAGLMTATDKNTLAGKMNTTNPTGTGNLSMNNGDLLLTYSDGGTQYPVIKGSQGLTLTDSNYNCYIDLAAGSSDTTSIIGSGRVEIYSPHTSNGNIHLRAGEEYASAQSGIYLNTSDIEFYTGDYTNTMTFDSTGKLTTSGAIEAAGELKSSAGVNLHGGTLTTSKDTSTTLTTVNISSTNTLNIKADGNNNDITLTPGRDLNLNAGRDIILQANTTSGTIKAKSNLEADHDVTVNGQLSVKNGTAEKFSVSNTGQVAALTYNAGTSTTYAVDGISSINDSDFTITPYTDKKVVIASALQAKSLDCTGQVTADSFNTGNISISNTQISVANNGTLSDGTTTKSMTDVLNRTALYKHTVVINDAGETDVYLEFDIFTPKKDAVASLYNAYLLLVDAMCIKLKSAVDQEYNTYEGYISKASTTGNTLGLYGALCKGDEHTFAYSANFTYNTPVVTDTVTLL